MHSTKYKTRKQVEKEIKKLQAALEKSRDFGDCIDIKDEIKSLELLLEYGE